MWIFFIVGVFFIVNGLLIYKFKLFKYAYILFYIKSIEKYMNIKEKEKFCNIVGTNQIILGIVVTLVTLILYRFQRVAIVIEMIFILFMSIYIRRTVRNI